MESGSAELATSMATWDPSGKVTVRLYMPSYDPSSWGVTSSPRWARNHRFCPHFLIRVHGLSMGTHSKALLSVAIEGFSD